MPPCTYFTRTLRPARLSASSFPFLWTKPSSAMTEAAARFFHGGTPTTTTAPSNNRDLDHDRSISMGNVRVDAAPVGSGRPDLIPALLGAAQQQQQQHLSANGYLAPAHVRHLRWMLQKDLVLQQDFVLLGPPGLQRDRRHLIMLYAALTGREVEYVALTRDTTDADLKQRKEVMVVASSSNNNNNTNNDTTTQEASSVYRNQAPVRAALHGRLLILDGLEKAERNVLPTLNNLLENRELSLDDGSLLVSPKVFAQQQQQQQENNGHDSSNATTTKLRCVHSDFRVAALASETATLDPPLRSRFQARLAPPLDAGEMWHALWADMVNDTTTLDVSAVQELVKLGATTQGDGPLSLQSMADAARYLQHGACRGVTPAAALKPYTMEMMGASNVKSVELSSQGSSLDTMADKAGSDSASSSLSLGFVETKTTRTIQNLVISAFDARKRAVVLVGPKGSYKSALVRHVAHTQQRPAELFSLYSDMTARDLLMTRGTDSDGNTVWRSTPLTRAVERGTWVILDGIDKISSDTLTSLALLMEQGQVDLPDGTRLQAGEGFRCVALAHPPHSSHDWISPEALGMFHWIRVEPLPNAELKSVLSGLFPALESQLLDKLINLRDHLDRAIQSGAADTHDEQESLCLSLRKMKHICRRMEYKGGKGLADLVHNALMTSFMPDRERKIVEKCMKESGISVREKKKQRNQTQLVTLDDNLLEQHRRSPTHPILVPQPDFEENPGHSRVLADILEAHSVGERALLIMGFQGVGKNRVVDRLLFRLQCEREYLQLHRDTTVQSLLSSPSIEDGRIVYGDSPLVRAAKNGRILVVDEADKAPVEVVALLKGLIEDGELTLPDGRVLRYESDTTRPECEPIHPDFRVWALANPTTYPFHGNDISGEMSDVFSCHTVPPLDRESQRRILKSYGADTAEETIEKIIDIWQDLRRAHEKGTMSYPFSVREAVSVVKHLNSFPDDGLEGALENVIAFDRFDSVILKQVGKIFASHGVVVSDIKDAGSRSEDGIEGGISTPRTRASSPKHGKIDENNDPHVGGNTWAGGSGGSDTAGLGGRGGPYRLDSGHPVHQVSDEMKAQVTEEANRQARKMAKDALKQKLKDLNMGKVDWERYDQLRQSVAVQIQQLQVMLKDIKRRKQERTWLRRQSTGELDDSRIVDALAGERDCFKRRGKPSDSSAHHAVQETEPMSVKLVVDISASMYRFNGYDGRLRRLLEATLMIMEALKDDSRFLLTIVGHNGDSAEIPLVDSSTAQDPATQLRVLEGMVAHTQYTWAGDSTLESIELAMSEANDGDLVLVISDANLQRYRIDPEDVSALLKRKDVHAHLILIGSLGEEASTLASRIPNERAQVCLDSADLPLIVKNIVASAAK